jgi:hypothetical protein
MVIQALALNKAQMEAAAAENRVLRAQYSTGEQTVSATAWTIGRDPSWSFL